MTTALAEIGDLFNDESTCAPAETMPETQTRLRRLPRSPWRSLGEHLDYSGWEARERFVRLDMEIMARKIQQQRIDARSKKSRGGLSIDYQRTSGSADVELLRGVA